MAGNGTTCTVTLSVLPSPALPAGVSISLPNNVVSATNQDFSRTLTLTANGVTPGSYPFTVQAARGSDCQGNGDVTVGGTLVVFGTPASLAFDQQPSNTERGERDHTGYLGEGPEMRTATLWRPASSRSPSPLGPIPVVAPWSNVYPERGQRHRQLPGVVDQQGWDRVHPDGDQWSLDRRDQHAFHHCGRDHRRPGIHQRAVGRDCLRRLPRPAGRHGAGPERQYGHGRSGEQHEHQSGDPRRYRRSRCGADLYHESASGGCRCGDLRQLQDQPGRHQLSAPRQHHGGGHYLRSHQRGIQHRPPADNSAPTVNSAPFPNLTIWYTQQRRRSPARHPIRLAWPNSADASFSLSTIVTGGNRDQQTR